MRYWLMKSEPEAFGIDDLQNRPQQTEHWDGVRNYQARNNLRAMKTGDLVCFYHSVTEKQIVGLARVAKEFYPDATATEGDWSCVDLVPVKALPKPVALETIKADPALKDLPLLKQSRLSVTPLSEVQFRHLLQLGGE